MACYIPRWNTRPKTVTRPGTNRARRALTSFMRRTPLTTSPRRRPSRSCDADTGLCRWGLVERLRCNGIEFSSVESVCCEGGLTPTSFNQRVSTGPPADLKRTCSFMMPARSTTKPSSALPPINLPGRVFVRRHLRLTARQRAM